MLRHYESLGLVTPSARTSTGYREYSADDIGRIFHIEGLRRLGLPLAEIGKLLSDPQFNAADLVADLAAATRERIASEQTLLTHLEQLESLGHIDGSTLLTTIDLMRFLESRDVIQRHTAALGGGIDGTVPVEALARAVLDESVLNAAGAMRWALAQTGPEAVVHLVCGLDAEDAEVRRNAIRALDEIFRTTSAQGRWTASVEDQSALPQRHDEAAAADSPDEASSTDRDDEVSATDPHDDITAALRAALNDTDLGVRADAAFALGRVLEPAAVDTLMVLAMGDERDIDAAEVLAGYVAGAPSPGGASAGAASPGDTSVSDGTAGTAHADPSSATAVPPWGSEERTRAAAEIMAQLRTHAASSDTSVRFHALQVLIEIPGAEADELIAELSTDPDHEVAAIASAALRPRTHNQDRAR